jgi:hydrogenase large subunit
MCFKNLPVAFDHSGRATLATADREPFSVVRRRPELGMTEEQRQQQIQKLTERNGHIRHQNIDPFTRIAGALAIDVTADLQEGRYLEAHSQAPLFRGYEVIAIGRDPRDAIFITSRACGVCGGVHSHASAYAIEMAMGLAPPPMGTVARNLGEAAEMGYDNVLHLYMLAAPDYSEAVVKATRPDIWEQAEKWECRHASHHGFKRMSHLMCALNPVEGELYREGLRFTRLSREMFSLLHGKYPHPQTITPGGVSSTIQLQTLNEYHSRLAEIFDYAHRMLHVWDEIPEFFYACDERFKDVGKLPMNFVDLGYWDDPWSYDATYEHCNEWGERRFSTPGVMIDGELVTTRLSDINIGVEEFVDHSYYEKWKGDRYAEDPAGNPLSPFHPWNKATLPKPSGKSWKEKYTWATAPRWDRQVMEAGCYARLFLTAKAQKHPKNRFYEATGNSIKMAIPKGLTPELDVEWKIPEVWNALERNRSRAYHYVWSQLVALESLLQGYDLMKQGNTEVSAVPPNELTKHMPKGEVRGVGFWGAGRGFLSHWCVLDKGRISNYQIITPSTWNASPRDPFGQPGPYEQSILNTPILEDLPTPKAFTSIDMQRAIRSFDPCMPCTTHVSTTAGGAIVREVNTCSCGADD